MCYSQVFTGLCIATSLMFAPFVNFSVFLVHEIGRGVFRPVKDSYLNKWIDAKERATTLSYESLVNHAGGAVGLVISGLLAKYLSIPVAWVAGGSILAVTAISLASKKVKEN